MVWFHSRFLVDLRFLLQVVVRSLRNKTCVKSKGKPDRVKRTIHKHSHTHTHIHARTTNMHARAHTNSTCKNNPKPGITGTEVDPNSFILARIYKCTSTITYTHTHTHTQTHKHSHAHTYTDTHTHFLSYPNVNIE